MKKIFRIIGLVVMQFGFSQTTELVSSGISGDAILKIEADTDNNNENDNPKIVLIQDGGSTGGTIGLTGDTNSSFTNSTVNGLYVKAPGSFDFQIATENTARVTVKNNGNVGIGTTSPNAGLHLWDNIANTNPGGTDKSIIRLTNSYASAFHSGGELQFGLNSHVLSTIKGTYTNWNNSNLGGSLLFYTRNSDGLGLKNRMQINANGNVGIGTTSPLTKLHINGRMMLDQGIIQKGGTPITNTTDLGLYSHLAGHWVRFVSNNAPIRFFTDIGNGGAGNDAKMSIESNGNIGIGTTSPEAKLDIFGQVDGDFNGLVIDNRKTYGANSGVNETSRILLSLSEDGTPNPLNRVFGIMEAGTLSETDSSNGRLSFLVRQNGSVSEKMRIMSNGNIGIGTTNTHGFKLGVKGSIAAEEVKVQVYPWSDFVFKKEYNLPSLEEVEQHIKDQGHLKDIPSAAEVEKDGIFLGDMDSKLLQKIEELTLYTIEQEKEIKASKKELQAQKTINRNLEERLQKIEALINKTN